MDKIILGVDPGCRYAGFGIARQEGTRIILLESGYLSMSAQKPLVERVAIFHDFFDQKVVQWNVNHLALEVPFLGKNAQNFLKLGYLRGILYLIAHRRQLHLAEFSPTEVKRAISGFGAASKEQVLFIVMRLFPTLVLPKKYDVTDAVAVTLCGLWKGQWEKPTLANDQSVASNKKQTQL